MSCAGITEAMVNLNQVGIPQVSIHILANKM